MKIWTVGLLFFGLGWLAGSACAQEDLRRFKLTPFSEMTPAQRAYADAVMAGPVAATGSAAVVPGAGPIPSMPFSLCRKISRSFGRWFPTSDGMPIPRFT